MKRILPMTILCLLIFLSVVFMVSCGKNVTDDLSTLVASTGTVSGKVITSDTKVGVGEAIISIGGRVVATSATDGSFIVAGVTPGNDQIVATRGTDVGSTTVAIVAGDVTQTEITIISKVTNSVTLGNLAIVGRVIDAVTGEGVDGVSVQVTDLGKSTMSRQWDSQVAFIGTAFASYAPTAATPNGPEHHGYFDFSNVPPGVHSFKFSKTGFFDKQVSFDCTAATAGAYFAINNLPLVYDSRDSGNISGYISFEEDGNLPGDTLDNNGALDENKRSWVATLELDTGLRTVTSVLDGRMGYYKFENLRAREVKYDSSGNITDPAYQITAKASYLETNAAGTVVIRNSYQKSIDQVEVDTGKTTIANIVLSQDDLTGSTSDQNVGPNIITPVALNPVSKLISTAPTFFWEVHSDAASYMVTVYHIESPGTDGTGGTTREVMLQEQVTTNTLIYPETGADLVNNEYYRLRVDAIKTTGYSVSGSSKMVNFMKVAPLAPTRIAPIDGEITDTSPTLAWNRGDHTGGFVVQLYTSIDDGANKDKCDFTKVIFQTVVSDTVFEMNSYTMNTDTTNTYLLHNHNYWWTVAQLNTESNSPIEFRMVTDINDLNDNGSATDLILDASKFTTNADFSPKINKGSSYARDGSIHIELTDPDEYLTDVNHEKHFHILYINDVREIEFYSNTLDYSATNDAEIKVVVSLMTEYGDESKSDTWTVTPTATPVLTTSNWSITQADTTVKADGSDSVDLTVSFDIGSDGDGVKGLGFKVKGASSDANFIFDPGSGEKSISNISVPAKGSNYTYIGIFTIKTNGLAIPSDTSFYTFSVETVTNGTSVANSSITDISLTGNSNPTKFTATAD